MARTVSFAAPRVGRPVRLLLAVIATAFVVLVIGSRGAMRVDAGHVGIRVRLAGSDRGIQDMPVVNGWAFFNPLTEQVVLFPTSGQNVVWAQSDHEGRPFDEPIPFRSGQGVNAKPHIGCWF